MLYFSADRSSRQLLSKVLPSQQLHLNLRQSITIITFVRHSGIVSIFHSQKNMKKNMNMKYNPACVEASVLAEKTQMGRAVPAAFAVHLCRKYCCALFRLPASHIQLTQDKLN